MEITLDIGKHIANDISKIADTDQIDFEIAALKLLDLGLRVHLANIGNDNSDGRDPIFTEILNESVKSNYLLKEVLGHIFVKDRSTFKAYDAISAYRVAESMADSFIEGKNTI